MPIQKDGTIFELQFHTKESLAIKGQIHGMYEEFRNANTKQERKYELKKEMIKISNSLTKPNGIANI